MGVNLGLDPRVISEVVNAARTKFKQGFKETQRIRSYKLQKMVFSSSETDTPEHAYEWTVRIKSAQGSTQMIDPYEQPSFNRDTYDTSLKATPCTVMTNLNLWVDNIVELINKGAFEKLWSAYNMRASACAEETAEMWESKLLNPPQTDGGKDGILGMLYQFRRSMTSGGVFTPQTTPARNGVYYRDGNGTVTSTMYGKDSSLAQFARLRTLVATHGGVMDELFLTTMRDCVLDAGFEYLDELKGDKTNMDLVILWDDAFERGYDDLCKALGSPRKRDFFEVGDTTLKGVPTVAVPSFNGHFLRPVIGWNRNELKFRKERGAWEQPAEWQATVLSYVFPEWSRGQMWAENPSTAGFLVHGSFTTGT